MSNSELYKDTAVDRNPTTIVSEPEADTDGNQHVSQFLQRSALAFGIRLSGASLSYLTQVFIARFLGVFDFGLYSFAWSCAFLLSIPAMMGLDSALVRYYSAYVVQADFAKVAGLLRFAVAITSLNSLAIIAVASTMTVFLAVGDSKHFASPVLVGLGAILPLALLFFGRECGRAMHRPLLALVPLELAFPILLLAAIGALTIMDAGRSAATVLSATVICLSIPLAGQAAGLFRSLPPQVRSARPRYEGGRWMQVALPIFITVVFGHLMERSDVLMVGMFLSPKEAAVYYAASRTAAWVQLGMIALLAFTAPSFSALHAAGRRQELKALVARVFRWNLSATVVAAVALIALSRMVMGLFGPGFTEGTVALVSLVVAQSFLCIQAPASTLLVMTGHQNITCLIYGVSAALSILLNTVFIPAFGIEGAAAATTIGWFVNSVWINLTVRRHFNFHAFTVT